MWRVLSAARSVSSSLSHSWNVSLGIVEVATVARSMRASPAVDLSLLSAFSLAVLWSLTPGGSHDSTTHVRPVSPRVALRQRRVVSSLALECNLGSLGRCGAEHSCHQMRSPVASGCTGPRHMEII